MRCRSLIISFAVSFPMIAGCASQKSESRVVAATPHARFLPWRMPKAETKTADNHRARQLACTSWLETSPTGIAIVFQPTRGQSQEALRGEVSQLASALRELEPTGAERGVWLSMFRLGDTRNANGYAKIGAVQVAPSATTQTQPSASVASSSATSTKPSTAGTKADAATANATVKAPASDQSSGEAATEASATETMPGAQAQSEAPTSTSGTTADPTAAVFDGDLTTGGIRQFMAFSPVVSVEDALGGVRLVFSARDRQSVAPLQASVRWHASDLLASHDASTSPKSSCVDIPRSTGAAEDTLALQTR